MEGEKRSYKFVIFLALIAAVAGAVIIGSILFSSNNNSTYRVTGLISIPGEPTEDGITKKNFKDSGFNLYKNGTFDVEIIYYDNASKTNITHFVGIGTYTKGKNTQGKDAYLCTFLDAYSISGGILKQDLGYMNTTEAYEILKNDKFRFELDGKFYTFGR